MSPSNLIWGVFIILSIASMLLVSANPRKKKKNSSTTPQMDTTTEESLSLTTDQEANIPSNERIVLDERSVLYDGVTIDYSYNETSTYGESVSSPGCPKSIRGHPWVHYSGYFIKTTFRCYLIGLKGPCPNNTKLLTQANSSVGICGCDCFDYYSNSDNRKSFCISNDINLPLVLVPKEGSCYPLLQKAVCKNDDEWLVLDKENKPVCETRKCTPLSATGGHILNKESAKTEEKTDTNTLIAGNYSYSFYKNETDDCHFLGEYCGLGPIPHSYPKRYQYQDSWIPICNNVQFSGYGLAYSINENCQKGWRWNSILGSCLKVHKAADI